MTRCEYDNLLEEAGVSALCRKAFYRASVNKAYQFGEDGRYTDEDIVNAARAFDALMPLDQATILVNVSSFYVDIVELIGDITNGEYHNAQRVVYYEASADDDIDEVDLGGAFLRIMGRYNAANIDVVIQGYRYNIADFGIGLLVSNNEFEFADSTQEGKFRYYYIENNKLNAWRD